jgi:hypothetical protein
MEQRARDGHPVNSEVELLNALENALETFERRRRAAMGPTLSLNSTRRLHGIVWPESHIQTRLHQPQNAYLKARLP